MPVLTCVVILFLEAVAVLTIPLIAFFTLKR